MRFDAVIRDTTLLPKLAAKPTPTQNAERAALEAFLLQRARLQLVQHPEWQDGGVEQVASGHLVELKDAVRTELATATATVQTCRTWLADPTRTVSVAIDDASIDKRLKALYASQLGAGPEVLRTKAMVNAIWRTLAVDPDIAIVDLHHLVSRRLWMTDRMLWYVASAVDPFGRPSRHFPNPVAGDLTDGWQRMFEYPRLDGALKQLHNACNPSALTGTCDVAGLLKDWTLTESQLHRDHRINRFARVYWKHIPDSYLFTFDRSGANNPIDAITGLFEKFDDYLNRNLLMCDQVLHALHLEAFVRVRSKSEGNTTWFTPIVTAQPEKWLSIRTPWSKEMLVGPSELRFFEHQRKVAVSDLMVGDHMIVYNHPAYDAAKDTTNVWRLENALAVTGFPRLRLQGHGTSALPFTSERLLPGKRDPEPSMRLSMLGHFRRRLKVIRDKADVENTAAVPRMVVTDLKMRTAVLVQRTVIGPHSGFDPANFSPAALKRARWWIRWDIPEPAKDEKSEGQIVADNDWAAAIWKDQRIELIDEGANGKHGFFPLWLPGKGSQPPIKRVEPVEPTPAMTPGWTWYYEKDETVATGGEHHVSVVRPGLRVA